MIALILLMILVAVGLGIAGFVGKGLLFLLIIGVVVFLAAFVLLGSNLRGRGRRAAR